METRIRIVDFSKESLEEREVQSVDEITEYQLRDSVTWVIVEGVRNAGVIEKLGNFFNVHPLVLEDTMNTHQRPKFEGYEDYLYIMLKCLVPEDRESAVNHEQISLLVLKNFVILFKEKSDDLMIPVQQRIRANNGRIRHSGEDYLAYAILDVIVDQYFFIIDKFDDEVNELEDQLLTTEPGQQALHQIQRLKKDIIMLKRFASPTTELLSAVQRCESGLISDSTQIYIRDVLDHSMRIIERIETYRETLTILLDIYMSSVSNKMNQIMKVLTVFASIFIPLTFLAGIYGMNFEYMSELKVKWAYPALWVLFILIPALLIYYFKRKKWL